MEAKCKILKGDSKANIFPVESEDTAGFLDSGTNDSRDSSHNTCDSSLRNTRDSTHTGSPSLSSQPSPSSTPSPRTTGEEASPLSFDGSIESSLSSLSLLNSSPSSSPSPSLSFTHMDARGSGESLFRERERAREERERGERERERGGRETYSSGQITSSRESHAPTLRERLTMSSQGNRKTRQTSLANVTTQRTDSKDADLKDVKEASPQLHVTLYYRSFAYVKGEYDDNLQFDRFGFDVDAELLPYLVDWQSRKLDPSRCERLRTFYVSNFAKRRKITDLILRSIADKGVPTENRPYLWLEWSGALLLKAKYPDGYYASLLLDSQKQRSPSTVQIKKDLERTFPNHPIFRSTESHQQLYRILIAFAYRNPEVGYCQSMNFIVGFLLIHLREECAFWVLCVIAETLLPNYFTPDLFAIRVDLRVLEDLAFHRMRGMMRHLSKYGIQMMQVNTIQWFLCLFVGVVPTECCLRIFDSFLNRGRYILFAVGLGLLKLNEGRLMRAKSYDEAFQILKSIPRKCLDGDEVLRVGRDELRPLAERIDVYRERVTKELDGMVKDRHFQILTHSTNFTESDLEALYIQFRNAAMGHLGPILAGESPLNPLPTVVTPSGSHLIGLNLEYFCQIMSGMYDPPLSDLASRLFQVFDEHGTGRLTFSQFVLGLHVVSQGSLKSKIDLIFKMYDRDADGFLDTAELHQITQDICICAIEPSNIPPSLYEGILQMKDNDSFSPEGMVLAVEAAGGERRDPLRISLFEFHDLLEKESYSVVCEWVLYVFQSKSVFHTSQQRETKRRETGK